MSDQRDDTHIEQHGDGDINVEQPAPAEPEAPAETEAPAESGGEESGE